MVMMPYTLVVMMRQRGTLMEMGPSLVMRSLSWAARTSSFSATLLAAKSKASPLRKPLDMLLTPHSRHGSCTKHVTCSSKLIKVTKYRSYDNITQNRNGLQQRTGG
jgi:hypothetical protein